MLSRLSLVGKLGRQRMTDDRLQMTDGPMTDGQMKD